MSAIDELAAEIGVVWRERRVTVGPDPPADAIARLDDADRRAAARQRTAGRQPRKAGAGDDDSNATEIVGTSRSSASAVYALLDNVSCRSSASTASIIFRASPNSIRVLSL